MDEAEGDNGHDRPMEPGERLAPREAILQALGDALSRQLLLLLAEAPRSPRDLLRSVTVPQSTLYRRLGELRALGLVDVQRSMITEDGKRMELYRSLLEEVEVRLHGGTLDVRARRRDLSAERLAGLWGEVREAGPR